MATVSSSDPGLTLRSIFFGVLPATSGGVSCTSTTCTFSGSGTGVPQPLQYFVCETNGSLITPVVSTVNPFCMTTPLFINTTTPLISNPNQMVLVSTAPYYYSNEPNPIESTTYNSAKWDLNCAQSAANTTVFCGVLAVSGFPNDVNAMYTSNGNSGTATPNQIKLGNLPVTVVATRTSGAVVTLSSNGGPIPPSASAATNTLPANAITVGSPSFTVATTGESFIATADVTNASPLQTASGVMTPNPIAISFVDPSAGVCVGNPHSPGPANSNYFRAAWYKLTTAGGGTVTVDTKDSSYDTRLVVISGDPVNSPTSITTVKCDDDLNDTSGNNSLPNTELQAELQFTAAAQSTYYIMASESQGSVVQTGSSTSTAAPLSYDPVLSLSVTTTGISSTISPTQVPIAFGSQAVNTTSSTMPITITAMGNLTNLKFTASSGFIASAGTCGTTWQTRPVALQLSPSTQTALPRSPEHSRLLRRASSA
jgi:hypothetical protein